MKNLKKILVSFFSVLVLILFASGCSDSDDNTSGTSRIKVSVTDNPGDYDEVNIEILDVKIKNSNGTDENGWVSIGIINPGVYNLLELTGGVIAPLSDSEIPSGFLGQIRLILGENNTVVKDGITYPLNTPSAQQSGLKVQIQQDVTGGVLYRLILDFDAAKSIVKAGNSGQYILKPVLRVLSFAPSGGSVKGVVAPDSIVTAIYAINGPDTVASTFTQVGNGNYMFKDLGAGTYNFSYVPNDTIHKTATRSVPVTLGQITIVDTVKLEKK